MQQNRFVSCRLQPGPLLGSRSRAAAHSHPSAVLLPAPEGAFQTLGRLRGFVGLCELAGILSSEEVCLQSLTQREG